jgi:hypothetical protein
MVNSVGYGLILDTCHPDALHLLDQECEDPWVFFEAKWSWWADALKKSWSGCCLFKNSKNERTCSE